MTSVEARFWAKVSGGDVDTCWEWTAALNGGYGVFAVTPKHLVRAHRWAYEALRAEIPDRLFLDHLCRNPPCVNPWHLEPVTPKVNSERGLWATKTHCPQGHPYSDQNTARRPQRDGRECITCRNDTKEQRRRMRAELLAADPAAAEHGSLSTYNDWMCRCQPCRDAMAEYRREWTARRAGRAA